MEKAVLQKVQSIISPLKISVLKAFFHSQILPKVLFQIDSIRERIENKKKEMALYDTAIAEIEQNFGNILFSANVFDDNTAQ